MKKKTKIIILFAFIIIIASSFFISSALASVRITSRNTTHYFEYYSSYWKELRTPRMYIRDTGQELYCIQHTKDCPASTYYNTNNIIGNYSQRVRTGLQIIIQNGYPNNYMGYNQEQARYITANAIRCWLSENGDPYQYNFTNLGAYSDSQLRSMANSGTIGSKIRAKSGNSGMLRVMVDLLIMARSQNTTYHSISMTTPQMNISGNYFVGTSTVTLSNMNGGYTLNTSSLPSGSSVSGYTGNSGDSLTIRIPTSEYNANKSYNIYATATDYRQMTNLFAYAPQSSSSTQSMLGYNNAYYSTTKKTSIIINTPFLPYPDLIVSSLASNKASYENGETITITASIKNQSGTSASGFYVSLSSGGVLNTQTQYISGLSVGSTRTLSFTFIAPVYSSNTSITFTATADYSNQVTESNENNNTRTRTVTILKALPDLTVTSLTSDKTQYEANGPIIVYATVKNIGKLSSSASALKLSVQGIGDFTANVAGLIVRQSRTVSFTMTAPASLTPLTLSMTATADYNNRINEMMENNNSRNGTIYVSALRPDITIIDTTIQNWYAGKDVCVSATLKNLTAQPVQSVAVKLQIGNISATENICIDGNGSNIAVFRFTVPNADDYIVTFTADPNGSINEIDENNNSISKNTSVVNIPPSFVINPDEESMEQRNDVYGVPNIPNTSSSYYHTWQEVRCENGSFITKDYWARLTAEFTISPDIRLPDNGDMMESGYGVSAACRTTLTTNYDNPQKLVGCQNVWVYNPESSYGSISIYENVRDNLQVKTGSAGDKTIIWEYKVNPYSVTNSKLHYTPLWYPDSAYIVLTQVFYAWSPIGQMYNYNTDNVIIEGDMYDRITTVKR